MVRSPAVSKASFSASGMPCSGPRYRPAAISGLGWRASAARRLRRSPRRRDEGWGSAPRSGRDRPRPGRPATAPASRSPRAASAIDGTRAAACASGGRRSSAGPPRLWRRGGVQPASPSASGGRSSRRSRATSPPSRSTASCMSARSARAGGGRCRRPDGSNSARGMARGRGGRSDMRGGSGLAVRNPYCTFIMTKRDHGKRRNAMTVRWDDGMVGASAPLGRATGRALRPCAVAVRRPVLHRDRALRPGGGGGAGAGPAEAPWSAAGAVQRALADLATSASDGSSPRPTRSAARCTRRWSASQVEHDGRVGYWDPVLWCDGRGGGGGRAGDVRLAPAAGRPGRGRCPTRCAASASATGWRQGGRRLEPGFRDRHDDRAGGRPSHCRIPAFVTFFTMRVLPDPRDWRRGPRTLRRRHGRPRVRSATCGAESPTVRLHDPLIRDLAPAEVLGGRVHWV